MKLKLDRIISIATLCASLLAIFLVIKRPAPVAPPQTPAMVQDSNSPDPSTMKSNDGTPQGSTSSVSSSPRTSALLSAQTSTASSGVQSGKADAKPNSDEISAVLAQALGVAGAGGLSPDSNLGSGAPPIKDQQVSVDGDLVHGKFLTEIAGKDVWITISGHIGEKDGFATFDPTEFKVGDMDVPVSLVNPALQRKLAEERDRLKVNGGAN